MAAVSPVHSIAELAQSWVLMTAARLPRMPMTLLFDIAVDVFFYMILYCLCLCGRKRIHVELLKKKNQETRKARSFILLFIRFIIAYSKL